MLRISIVTTNKHNVGDDFVREGIVHLLQSVKSPLNIECVHKHSPVSSVYGFEGIRRLRISRLFDPVLRTLNVNNRITDADLLIQSGAPIYWCHDHGSHCADNEWFDPIVRKRFLKDRHERKFLNIAGGSCQRYHSDGSEIGSCPKCKAYIAEFFDVCDLTLLRDDLAKKMLNHAGRDAIVLPCTSIFARDYLNVAPKRGDYIVVNFMEYGGHYMFSGQNINKAKWRANFGVITRKLREHGHVIAACHTQNEANLAREIIPDIETYIVPNDHIAFVNFYAGARFAIVNRVHAGFMMASFGRPVAVIGNDSRALMIKNLNLAPYFVEEIEPTLVDQIIDELLMREHSYLDEIEEIRRKARSDYVEIISRTIGI